MKLTEGLKEALDTVAHNKFRTFLTMLGMFIGVAAVIAIISAGLMARESIMGSVDSLGSGLLWVSPNYDAYEEAGNYNYVNMVPEDLEAMKGILGDLIWMNPVLEGNEVFSRRGFTSTQQLYGIEENYQLIWNLKISKGRFFLTEEIENRQKVIILGPQLVNSYFDSNEDPIGQVISVGNSVFRVIGVLEKREQSFMSDGSGDGTSYIPYHAYSAIYDWSYSAGQPVVGFFSAKVSDPARMEEVKRIIQVYLDVRYGLLEGNSRFRIRTPEKNMETFNKIFSIITTVISLIAGISLLVSGIGIMNIMLVTVTERTKEIGVRKAVGAKNKDILSQFLIETVFVCLLGGIIGVLLGFLIAYVIAFFQHWNFYVPFFAVLIGLSVSAFIGLVSGIYPAMKASAMPPVLALTKE